MDLKETAKLLTMIQCIYPNANGVYEVEKPEKMKAIVRVWHGLLQDINFAEAEKAFIEYARNEHYAPKPSDIILYVTRTRNPEAFITGEEAWEKVASVASKIGFYRQKEAYAQFSPRTLRVVKAVGWERICRSERPEFVKKDFCSIYENISKTEQEILKLPYGYQGQYLPEYGQVKSSNNDLSEM